ncbi:sugar ABC transporter ATP-binding protein [Conexibacter sp. CPCC 206217]|uniref:sugar ABC transporter ATP-binding protein n=1 Tax=Conexibacter sp. CPCC 206217 TaxID=3064574 RepID=UPI0027229027|nr:sugar ABC transporter ATP-binding protein [Conexibacter sp. CPCC 206217]MDO8211079.1 sugar ABC transporter ATP-binding protein [Conexibacter sp. CPCC 206217]
MVDRENDPLSAMETAATTSTTVSADATPALAVHGLRKTFAGVAALKGVDVGFRRGAVTALLGPNGCGKSTLIKILAGFHAPDDGGTVEIGGQPVSTPIAAGAAYAAGLRFVHQDLGLVAEMSVLDNLALADGFDGRGTLAALPRRAMARHARELLARFGLDVAPGAPVGALNRTDQIMVAIARAFQSLPERGADRIVILDEPTASLPAGSVDRVLDAVDRIRADGGTVVYVTHRIDEVLRIADDVVVLRDGEVAERRPVAGLDEQTLVDVIMGEARARKVTERAAAGGAVVLRAERLRGERLDGITFELRRGETLGVAGLAGCGRSELARLLTGAQRLRDGTLVLDGEPLDLHSPRAALERGIAFVPPDRHRDGGIPDMSVRHNVGLSDLSPFFSHGLLSRSRERSTVSELLEQFDVRPRDTERRLDQLSGGNQQKVVLAKFARLRPRLLVVDEPTQGVDVAGKQEIGTALQRLAAGGCAIVLASSDFDEIGELCDRVLVLDRGVAVGIYARGEINEERLAALTSRGRGAGGER